MERKKEVIIGLGSSLGNRKSNLLQAVRHLDASPHCDVMVCSRIYKSLPLGPAIGFFLNAAVKIATSLSPFELLRLCKLIEIRNGRSYGCRWGDRTIDLDILLFDDLFMDKPNLRIPHLELLNRSFALYPAIEVGGDFWHPVVAKQIKNIVLKEPWPCWEIGALSVASLNRTQY